MAVGLWGGRCDRLPARRRSRVAGAHFIAFAAASLLLVAALPLTDEAGFIASGVFVAWHVCRVRG